jgi:tRNA-specific 2-thiouridylase
VAKDVANNRLVVGTEKDLALFSNKATVTDWQWTSEAYGFPWQGMSKIRYRQEDQAVVLSEMAPGTLQAEFSEPQRAITPGQFLVAYSGDELVGSGIITG